MDQKKLDMGSLGERGPESDSSGQFERSFLHRVAKKDLTTEGALAYQR